VLVPGQSEELLRELHLVSRDGKVHADSLRKLKQVNHLVGLIAPAVADALGRSRCPQLLDAGAGNAYLGFVLYELLLRDTPAVLWSIETRPELVERARERAARLGYSRMRFVARPLAEVAVSGSASDSASESDLPSRLHVVTALHACDTATDDALALAVRRKADHVAVVPCCQAELAAQLARRPSAQPPLPSLWSHPIHRREFGAHLTNVVRALSLQSLGYQVTVTELTGWEHSLKNELILARRVGAPLREKREELRALLCATGVRPRLVALLLPELLPAPVDGPSEGE
jgi:hypothetical protein